MLYSTPKECTFSQLLCFSSKLLVGCNIFFRSWLLFPLLLLLLTIPSVIHYYSITHKPTPSHSLKNMHNAQFLILDLSLSFLLGCFLSHSHHCSFEGQHRDGLTLSRLDFYSKRRFFMKNSLEVVQMKESEIVFLFSSLRSPTAVTSIKFRNINRTFKICIFVTE